MDKFFTVLENKTGIDTGNTGETYKATPPQSPHSKRNTQLSKRLPTLTGNAGAELAAFALAYQCFVEREDPDQAEELLGLEKAPSKSIFTLRRVPSRYGLTMLDNICFFLGDLAEKSEAGVLPTDKLSILKLNGYVILIRHIVSIIIRLIPLNFAQY